MLKVSRKSGGEAEVFHSIQGEGVSIGVPSVFLRLATCNLSCRWCDTKYTWDWANFNYNTEVVELDTAELRHKIQAFQCPHVVVTGGEPLLQQAELGPLVASLADEGFTFEVQLDRGLCDHQVQFLLTQDLLRTDFTPNASAHQSLWGY